MSSCSEVMGSRVSTWGEGPIWWNDRLLYVDIEEHKVVSLDPADGSEKIWDVGERVGTVVPRANGGLVIAGDNGFSFLDPDSGKTTPIADPEPDKKPDNRFNDGKCDPAGRFWAGTISLVKNVGDAALYRLDPNGTVTLKFPDVTTSNGICWSADARTMYYIDTLRKQVLAFDFDNTAGEISKERVIIDTMSKGFDTSPDGMAIDANGNLWVAFCHGGCVVCFDSATAEVLEQIDFPCIETTACAFGGPDLKQLFVTTGVKKGLDEPLAGRVFVCEPGVSGVPAFPFAG